MNIRFSGILFLFIPVSLGSFQPRDIRATLANSLGGPGIPIYAISMMKRAIVFQLRFALGTLSTGAGHIVSIRMTRKIRSVSFGIRCQSYAPDFGRDPGGEDPDHFHMINGTSARLERYEASISQQIETEGLVAPSWGKLSNSTAL